MMARSPRHPRHSRIYIIRLWTEESEANDPLLRGLVRNVESGEARYFRSWQDVVAFMDDAENERRVAEEEKQERKQDTTSEKNQAKNTKTKQRKKKREEGEDLQSGETERGDRAAQA